MMPWLHCWSNRLLGHRVARISRGNNLGSQRDARQISRENKTILSRRYPAGLGSDELAELGRCGRERGASVRAKGAHSTETTPSIDQLWSHSRSSRHT